MLCDPSKVAQHVSDETFFTLAPHTPSCTAAFISKTGKPLYLRGSDGTFGAKKSQSVLGNAGQATRIGL